MRIEITLLLAITIVAAACEAPPPAATPLIMAASNAIPADKVRIDQTYRVSESTGTCEHVAPGGISNGIPPGGLDTCVDDVVYPCYAVDDFPVAEIDAIKTFYSACTVKEVTSRDGEGPELFVDCQNCSSTPQACTCGGGSKQETTCTFPLTGMGQPPAICHMLYPND